MTCRRHSAGLQSLSIVTVKDVDQGRGLGSVGGDTLVVTGLVAGDQPDGERDGEGGVGPPGEGRDGDQAVLCGGEELIVVSPENSLQDKSGEK